MTDSPTLSGFQNLPEWHLRASCRGADQSLFFSEKGGSGAYWAKQICASCPVKAECLEWAIQHHELGVWGGTTARERQWMRSGRTPLPGPLPKPDGKSCTFCPEPAKARGLCNLHYQRWRIHGDPTRSERRGAPVKVDEARLRELDGLTAGEAAEVLGVHKSTVGEWRRRLAGAEARGSVSAPATTGRSS